MSSPSRIQHPLRAEKRRTFNQKKNSRQPQNTISPHFFPPPTFSTHWKQIFQSLENPRNFFSNHWRNHSKFSTHWKLFFQPLENFSALHQVYASFESPPRIPKHIHERTIAPPTIPAHIEARSEYIVFIDHLNENKSNETLFVVMLRPITTMAHRKAILSVQGERTITIPTTIESSNVYTANKVIKVTNRDLSHGL